MLKDKVDSLPDKPGVYLYKNSGGVIIYVGKAKSLKKRVKSYFTGSHKDVKTQQLVKFIDDMDYIVTKNELEAFVLENTLIKEHMPRYNIMYKDDKSYPFLKITSGNKYPGVYMTRMLTDKKASYYGPYFGRDAKKVLHTIYRVFKVRQCKIDLSKPLKRPCIYFDTGVCTAPCVRYISEGDYSKTVKEVKRFLTGDYKVMVANLQKEMQQLSDDRKYEKAAEIRDAINAVKEIMTEQKVVSTKKENVDVIDFMYQKDTFYFCVLNIRSGRLLSKRISVFEDMVNDETAMEVFLSQYFSRNIYIPEKIILPEGSANVELLKATVFKGKKVKITFSKKGRLLVMARENIHEKIKQDNIMKSKKAVKRIAYDTEINELKANLEMFSLPKVIEGIDISHMHGDDMVGSCVVFRDGEPDKNSYRRYRIKSVKYIDDYKAIKEVVSRRYSKMEKEGKPFPDLILIDGGKGQVNAAKEELEKLDIYPEIIGLAKKKEEVFKPYSHLPSEIGQKARFLLQRVRDEAHRFAVSYVTNLANKKLKKSIFDEINGIGEKTKQNIYLEFKSTDELIAEIEKDSERVDFLTKKQKETLIEKLEKNSS